MNDHIHDILDIQGSADMHVYKYGRNGDAGIGVGAKAIAPIVSYSFGVKYHTDIK